MNKDSRIYVAGHRGLVGSAIVRNLKSKGYSNIITRTHSELDLLDQTAVSEFFEKEKPDFVFLAAAHVGGIGANSTYPADFIYQNMMIGFNIVEASRKNDIWRGFYNFGVLLSYKNYKPSKDNDITLKANEALAKQVFEVTENRCPDKTIVNLIKTATTF